MLSPLHSWIVFICALVLTSIQVITVWIFCFLAAPPIYSTKFGFIDKTGKFVIQPKYYRVENFRNGVAQVGLDSFIDHSGATVESSSIKSKYERPLPTYKMDDVADIYESSGRESTGGFFIRIKDAAFLPFSEGLAAKKAKESNFFGFVDHQYNLVIEPTFRDVRSFKEGVTAVALADGIDYRTPKYRYGWSLWGYIDRQGQWVTKPRFLVAERFSEGLACVTAPRPEPS